MKRTPLLLTICSLALLALTAPASAAGVRSCSDRVLPAGPDVVKRSAAAQQSGWVRARLDGPSAGDWDLAVFERRGGRLVASSSSFASTELAEGLAARGTELVLQACRISGSGRGVRIELDSEPLPGGRPEKVSLVRVATPTRDRKDELNRLGLDVTEHGGKRFVSVILHGADDARTLRENKFSFSVDVPDLVARDIRDRAADARFAARARASALPSGRTGYRRLGDYGEDLKKLVRENPGLVRPITLPHKTWEGRSVEGVEITTGVDNLRDGKPVFLQMGVHHAREWPSGEHAIEWAFELVKSYKAGDARTRRLVGSVRTIVIPIVNPDGFNISREAGEAQQGGDGRGTPNAGEENETANIVSHPYEYRRKNCRLPDGDGGSCLQPSLGVASLGVDPNRNYGAFWGGPGASPSPENETYFGPAPFSEPETRNVRDLVSGRHVTTLITNHTFSDLVLRAPGLKSQGLAADEPAMKALGDSMAAENGYLSMYGWQLYDTTGTTEDWSYSATGGYGYTFEIGCVELNRTTNECVTGHFHPPYAEMVKEWDGTTQIADEGGRDGGGNREAYYKAMENAADTAHHSLLRGKAPGGVVLRLKKSFQTPTSTDTPVTDTLDTTYEVPGSGSLGWHINPSTRPLVAAEKGRPPTGDASPPQTIAGNAPPVPACPGYHDGVPLPGCFRDHVIDVPAGPGIDNGFATLRVEWASPASDYDVEVYRDTNANGAVDAGEPIDGTSGQGTTDFEQVTLGPDPSGRYILRVVNYAASEPYDLLISFQQPKFSPAQRENWTLSCETQGGTVLSSQDVYVARGQSASVTLSACAKALREAFESGRGCDRPTGRVRGRRLDRVRLGGLRGRHLRAYKVARKGPRSIDRFCLADGRQVRAAYPRGRVQRAVLVLTSSRRFRIRGVRVGTREATLVRRGLRPLRVGRNTWYLRTAKRARLVYKVRNRRVREVGLAAKSKTKGRGQTRRLLRRFR